MIVVANVEAKAGIGHTVDALKNGTGAIDALVEGISFVEADPTVRSVGYGGWPNMIGDMECDGGAMDGDTLEVGCVGAVPKTLHTAALAKEVMRRLPHVMLTGEGAFRFANEIGFKDDAVLHPDSKKVWWDKLDALLSEEEKAQFPDIPLAPLSKIITDPERVRDTTVFIGQDQNNSIGAVTSTSGWAWKYPGRLGDSPIPGAGFYADSRYGAAACTHTGEMTMRLSSAHTVVQGLKYGLTLEDAVMRAADELLELKHGFIGEVVIHAIDAKGGHLVVNLLGQEPLPYWFWEEAMSEPEVRQSKLLTTKRG